MRQAAALVYVDDLNAPRLSDTDAHHLGSSLRLRQGEVVVACDGAGAFRACEVAAGTATSRSGRPMTLSPVAEVSTELRPAPLLTIGFSLAKGDRTEWAVAKLVELGVDRIVPMLCDRTVARPSDLDARRTDRLRRIAREAAMQARLAWLPEISGVVQAASMAGKGAALAEPGGPGPSLATPTILVGPEGGWSAPELAWAVPRVGLGSTILRIETAAVAAGALLTAMRAGVIPTIDPTGG